MMTAIQGEVERGERGEAVEGRSDNRGLRRQGRV